MFELSGKPVGTVLISAIGPITGRNYDMFGTGSAPTPTINVSVVGSGSVEVFATTTGKYVGSSFGEWVADDTAWASLGTASSGAPLTANLPVGTEHSFYKVVVSAPGVGKVTVSEYLPRH